jgi:hypothetical protein
MAKIILTRRQLEATYQSGAMREVTKNLNVIVGDVFASRYLSKAFVRSIPDLIAELRLEGESIKKSVILVTE